MELAFIFPDQDPRYPLGALKWNGTLLPVGAKHSKQGPEPDALQTNPIDLLYRPPSELLFQILVALALQLKAQEQGRASSPWRSAQELLALDETYRTRLTGSVAALTRAERTLKEYLERRQLLKLRAEEGQQGLLVRELEHGTAESSRYRLGGIVERLKVKVQSVELEYEIKEGGYKLSGLRVNPGSGHLCLDDLSTQVRASLESVGYRGPALETVPLTARDIVLDVEKAETWLKRWQGAGQLETRLVVPTPTSSQGPGEGGRPLVDTCILLIFPETPRNYPEVRRMTAVLGALGARVELVSYEELEYGDNVPVTFNSLYEQGDFLFICTDAEPAEHFEMDYYTHLWSTALALQIQGENRGKLIPVRLLPKEQGKAFASPMMLAPFKPIEWARDREEAIRPFLRSVLRQRERQASRQHP